MPSPQRAAQPVPIEVLFVCLGNICRSPTAHAVFEARIGDALRSFDSAGLGGWHVGERPDPRARRAGMRRGYAVDHLVRQVTDDDFDRFALIVAMEPTQVTELRERRRYARTHHIHLADPDLDQIVLLRDFDPLADGSRTVDDPYYADDDAFEQMLDVIERSVDGLAAHIDTLLGQRRGVA